MYSWFHPRRLSAFSEVPQRNAVSEYWIVDLEGRVVERWHPEDERPQILADTVEWSPDGASAPFVLELAPYFAEVVGEDS